MSSFYGQQTATMALPVYDTTNDQSSPVFRTDSPFSHTSPASSRTGMDVGANQSQSTPDGTSGYVQASLDASNTQRPRTPNPPRRQTQPPTKSSGCHFFVDDNPSKLKDRKQMKAVRQHVMHDYLDKERKKPMSSDIRVTGIGSAARKRKRLNQLPPTTNNPLAPSNIFGQPQSFPSPGQSSHSSCGMSERHQSVSSLGSAPSPIYSRGSRQRPRTATHGQFGLPGGVSPLVRGIAGGLSNSKYLQTSLEHIPGPLAQSYLGSNIEPFARWPDFQDSTLDIQELKWSCSRKFGTQGMAQNWVPTLLKAKHAFLSTVCISASHDDIMKRGLQQPHERPAFASDNRTKVRDEVITLINQAIQDPKTQTTDATLISILHLLNSEIMGCDDKVMKVHQNGLHGLVQQRGGLESLGVDGQLASILTITMYMISALRETEPHEDYIKHAMQKRTKPPNHQGQLPESPVYCRAFGFHTIKRAVPETSPTLSLLEDLRQLTHAFVRGSGSSFVSPLTPVNAKLVWQQSPNSVTMLKNKIFALPNAEEQPNAFSNMNDKYTYEALRLVALVYALALADEIPFSKAATKLSASYTNMPTVTQQQQQASDTSSYGSPATGYSVSWHLAIKSALVRTNLSDCWGHMAGVLFWLSLVAGACANPDSSANKPRGELSAEEEEGRKYLAAIAVRCSIVLSFEYGGAILETLKRMVGIEQALSKADADRGALDEWLARENVVFGPMMGEQNGGGMFGPLEEPFVQRTFADFAADFMSDFV